MKIKNKTLLNIEKSDIIEETVTIPQIVDRICSKAFQNVSSIKKIVIPKTVSNIDSKSFYNCFSLTDVTIHDKNFNIKCLLKYPCIIKSVKETSIYTIYKIEILLGMKNNVLNLKPQYIVFVGEYGGRGKTIKHAIFNLINRIYYNEPLKERIKKLSSKFEKGKKYKSKEFYAAHFILTYSCESGRKNVIDQNNINLKDTEMTLEEFVQLCENLYGGEIISQLTLQQDN